MQLQDEATVSGLSIGLCALTHGHATEDQDEWINASASEVVAKIAQVPSSREYLE